MCFFEIKEDWNQTISSKKFHPRRGLSLRAALRNKQNERRQGNLWLKQRQDKKRSFGGGKVQKEM